MRSIPVDDSLGDGDRRQTAVTDYVCRCGQATTVIVADMLAIELAMRMPYLRLTDLQRVTCMVAILEIAFRNNWYAVADSVLAKAEDVVFLWSRVDMWHSPERADLVDFVRRKKNSCPAAMQEPTDS